MNAPRVGYDPEDAAALVRAFVDELDVLSKHGNAQGARVKTLGAIVIYDNGEVYTHRAGAFDDPMLLLGALRYTERVWLDDSLRMEREILKRLNVAHPMPRTSLECGARFMTNAHRQWLIEKKLDQADVPSGETP